MAGFRRLRFDSLRNPSWNCQVVLWRRHSIQKSRPGHWRRSGKNTVSSQGWSVPTTSGNLTLLSSEAGLLAARRQLLSQNLATTLNAFVSKTRRDVHIALPRREASMQRKIIRTTGTAFSVFFTIPLKAEIFGPGKRTFIGWRKSAILSLINASPKASLLLVNMGDCLPTGHLEEPRSQGRFMREAKLDSNCCWEPTRLWRTRSPLGQ